MSNIADSIKRNLIALIRCTIQRSPEEKISFGTTVITVPEPNSGMLDYPSNNVQLTGVEINGRETLAVGEYDPENYADEDPEPIMLSDLSCDALIEILGTIQQSYPSDEGNAEFAAMIPYSSLVEPELQDWIEENINSCMPFSYGDCNRSLVTASDLTRHIEQKIDCPEADEEEEEEMLENAEGESPEAQRAFLKRVRDLGEIYIDLAN